MDRRTFRLAAYIAFSLVFLTRGVAQAEMISLKSGNGAVGTTDTEISMLVGPANAAFGTVFTEAVHFSGARSGPAAWINTPDGAWKSGLDSDPSAMWIGTRNVTHSGVWGDTALFAMDFEIVLSTIDSAILDMDFLVDNDLGSALNTGLYINGLEVLGSKRTGASPTYFQTDQSFSTFDVTSLVQPGQNWLYVYMVDHTGPSGVLFSATITAVPEQSTIALVVAGLMILLAYGARRRAHAARPPEPQGNDR